MRTVGIALCAAALAFTAAGPALADKPDKVEKSSDLSVPGALALTPEAKRDAARTLAAKGSEMIHEGHYSKAIPVLAEAERLYHAPTIVVLLGQAHEGAGKLVEARDYYERAAGEELAKTAPREFYLAKNIARESLSAIEKRLPKVQVIVQGGEAKKVKVKVDDKPVEPFDKAHAVNPGSHKIDVSYIGGATFSQSVTLNEGATERVTVPLWVVEKDPDRVSAPVVAFGAMGIAGLAVGAVTGALAIEKLNEGGGECSPENAASARKLTAVSLGSFVAGGLGVGLSAFFLYLDRPRAGPASPPPSNSSSYSAVALSPGAISITGVF
jgi:hypothetical protein